MNRRFDGESKALTIVPIVSVLAPVGAVLATDSSVYASIFTDPSVHVLTEFFCMFVALAAAAFMLMRHPGERSGVQFWFACGLLVQGSLIGFHALNAGREIAIVFQRSALLTGAIFSAAVWLPMRRPHRGTGRMLPLVLTVVTALVGYGVQRWSGVVLDTFGTVATAMPTWSSLIAVTLYAVAAARLAVSYRRIRRASTLWVAAFCSLMAIAVAMPGSLDSEFEPWLHQLLKVAAFSILVSYVTTVSAREVRRLGQTEDELRRSEARFKALTENTSDIVFVVDREGVFTYVSPAAARIAGVRSEELLGRPPGDYTHPDDMALIEAGLENASSHPGESVRIGTIRVRHTGGRWIHAEGVYTCLYDDPNIDGVVLSYRDVTERIVSEAALDQSRRRLSRMIRNLPGMVYRCRADDDFTLDYVSDYSEQLTGWSAEDFMRGRVTAHDVVHADDLTRLREKIREALDEDRGFHIEYRMTARDGTVAWVMEHGIGVRDGRGRLESVEGFILDMTDLQRSRHELRRTKFSVDNAMEALFWVDRQGRLVDVNETTCRYLGYTREELQTMYLKDVSTDIAADDWPRIWNWVRDEGAVMIEAEHLTKTGRRFPVEISSIFLEFEGEEYHCCFVRDITERKEVERQIQKLNLELEQRVRERTSELEAAQAQLVTSEKMAALGNLVAGVAHEINTPLGIGVTAASHLDKKVGEVAGLYEEQALRKSDLEQFLDLARESSSLVLTNLRRAADLVQGFKQVSVDQSSERRRVFALGEYLDEIVRSLKPEYRSYGHEVGVNCAETLSMDSYPGALAQVVTNLIINSVRHGFEDREGGRIWFNVDGDGDSIRLLYKDDGRGMAPEQLRKLYDPFFTTKRGRGGSGLGMNIVYNLVTQVLKGTIECQSAMGQGTVFLLVFPRETPLDLLVEEPATAGDATPDAPSSAPRDTALI